MQEVIAHMTFDDARSLEPFAPFKFAHMDFGSRKIESCEWGCIQLPGLRIRVFADIETETKTVYRIRDK
jgi:hypothetical protein